MGRSLSMKKHPSSKTQQTLTFFYDEIRPQKRPNEEPHSRQNAKRSKQDNVDEVRFDSLFKATAVKIKSDGCFCNVSGIIWDHVIHLVRTQNH